MKALDPMVFYAVLVEMMGPWLFWSLILLTAFGLGTFAWVIFREKGLSSRRLVRCELIGVAGGFGALWLMAYVTVSGFTDAGGPVDWLLIGLIWGGGLVGTTILSYASFGLRDRFRWQKRIRTDEKTWPGG
ncbi:DUF5368 domain-containing protein [Propionivibrio limicola]|uniref:DUF5368 domain-containing protein n=1 Tax=Propionivibrio limicola TaxID=167645 RepID=UPI0012926A81|nr:DUF5368 domain-containing protein [Propionivibrio limicola]